jgi:hypothetical protein
LIPSAYKASKGIKGFAHRNRKCKGESAKYTWSYVSVLSILRNQLYIGDMVNHKFEIANYRTKKLVAVPKEKHIIVPNTHEPIVSRSDYEKVQTLIVARTRPLKNVEENLFKSLLFCKECGKRMTLSYQSIKGKGGAIDKRAYYRCLTRYNPRYQGQCHITTTFMPIV